MKVTSLAKNSVSYTLGLGVYAATLLCSYEFSLLFMLHNIDGDSNQRKKSMKLVICMSKSTFEKVPIHFPYGHENIKCNWKLLNI